MKRISWRGAAIAGAVLVLSACLSNRASGQNLFAWVPSARAWGMGLIGAGDPTDPQNILFNPAIIASAEGEFVTTYYQKLDADMSRYSIGGGWTGRTSSLFGEVIRFGGAFRYDVFDLGDICVIERLPFTLPCPTKRLKEKIYDVTAGVEVTANRRLSAGAGFSVKPWRSELDGEARETGTIFDAGLLVRTVILDLEDTKLSASVGAGFLNLGGNEHTPSDLHRYGLGIHYEGATSRYFHERLGVDVPICSITVDYELTHEPEEAAFEHHRAWGAGAEVAFWRILFLRTGFFKSASSVRRDGAFGLGLGWTFKQGWARFDFASAPDAFTGREQDTFIYGLVGGFAF